MQFTNVCSRLTAAGQVIRSRWAENDPMRTHNASFSRRNNFGNFVLIPPPLDDSMREIDRSVAPQMNQQQSEHDVGIDISGLRQEYKLAPLKRKDMPADPFQQFQAWFQQACDSDILEPNAGSLATVDAENRPALRTVLLKYFDKRGFIFFTNLGSAKAEHIARNANVALMFLWSVFGHQVIIRGTAEKLQTKEVMRYFLTRPRGSQIGAWVSVQSHVISSRSLLAAKFDEMKRKFTNREVPLPSFWGGYRVMPVEMEFWQGQPDRLHDRFLYTRESEGNWKIERLQP